MNLIQFIADFSTVIGWVVASLIAAFMLYMRSKFVPREDHDKLKSDFDDAVRRIDHVEMRISQLPSSDTIQSLNIQMTKLEGELKSVTVRFEALDDMLSRLQTQTDRMEDFLKHKM